MRRGDRPAYIHTISSEEMLQRLLKKHSGLCAERDRLNREIDRLERSIEELQRRSSQRKENRLLSAEQST
jgi:predicted RNase H-like nuclease (RuvC/YqgF family)